MSIFLRERPGRGQAFTNRFFGKGVSEVGVVILSAAKNLSPSRTQILRCAQNDRRERRVSKNLPVKGKPRPPAVILSAAKDLLLSQAQILRCAQDDIRVYMSASGGRAAALVNWMPCKLTG